MAVLAGLAVCVAAVLCLEAEPSGRRPGVALDSGLILAVEQALVLFAAWMFVVVVVTRALHGELPTEISGRGVRYADAVAIERAVGGASGAVTAIEDRLDELCEDVLGLQRRVTSGTVDKADML